MPLHSTESKLTSATATTSCIRRKSAIYPLRQRQKIWNGQQKNQTEQRLVSESGHRRSLRRLADLQVMIKLKRETNITKIKWNIEHGKLHRKRMLIIAKSMHQQDSVSIKMNFYKILSRLNDCDRFIAVDSIAFSRSTFVVVVSITFCYCEKMRFRLPADSSDRTEAAAATGTWLSCVAYALVHFDLENVCCCCTTTYVMHIYSEQRGNEIMICDGATRFIFFLPKMSAIYFVCYRYDSFSRSCNHHMMNSWSRRNGKKCKYFNFFANWQYVSYVYRDFALIKYQRMEWSDQRVFHLA